MSDDSSSSSPDPDPDPDPNPNPNPIERGAQRLLERIRAFSSDDWRTSLLLPLLAFVSALVLSGLVVILSDIDNLRLLGSDPGGAIANMFQSVGNAYWALLTGSLGSTRALSETLTNATPFIIVGLGLGVGFRAGLFNIGGQGQMIVGGLFAAWVGFTVNLPGILVVPLAISAGFLGGALYGAIPGVLKAKTGAHEVIVTIMLNNIALLGLTWVLKTSVFQADGRVDPISKPIDDAARLPRLLGFLGRSDLRVHLGFLIAIGLAIAVWWLLFRSTVGFEFRSVGANPSAAQYGGMNVTMLTVLVMAVSGGLAGIGGANELLGVQGRAAPGFVGGIGFDAISVSLLGRNHPAGIVLAGLLFGALKAGAQQMQAKTNVPVDMIQIVQALIIIFVAAPALTRQIFRVRVTPEPANEGLVAS